MCNLKRPIIQTESKVVGFSGWGAGGGEGHGGMLVKGYKFAVTK